MNSILESDALLQQPFKDPKLHFVFQCIELFSVYSQKIPTIFSQNYQQMCVDVVKYISLSDETSKVSSALAYKILIDQEFDHQRLSLFFRQASQYSGDFLAELINCFCALFRQNWCLNQYACVKTIAVCEVLLQNSMLNMGLRLLNCVLKEVFVFENSVKNLSMLSLTMQVLRNSFNLYRSNAVFVDIVKAALVKFTVIMSILVNTNSNSNPKNDASLIVGEVCGFLEFFMVQNNFLPFVGYEVLKNLHICSNNSLCANLLAYIFNICINDDKSFAGVFPFYLTNKKVYESIFPTNFEKKLIFFFENETSVNMSYYMSFIQDELSNVSIFHSVFNYAVNFVYDDFNVSLNKFLFHYMSSSAGLNLATMQMYLFWEVLMGTARENNSVIAFQQLNMAAAEDCNLLVKHFLFLLNFHKNFFPKNHILNGNKNFLVDELHYYYSQEKSSEKESISRALKNFSSNIENMERGNSDFLEYVNKETGYLFVCENVDQKNDYYMLADGDSVSEVSSYLDLKSSESEKSNRSITVIKEEMEEFFVKNLAEKNYANILKVLSSSKEKEKMEVVATLCIFEVFEVKTEIEQILSSLNMTGALKKALAEMSEKYAFLYNQIVCRVVGHFMEVVFDDFKLFANTILFVTPENELFMYEKFAAYMNNNSSNGNIFEFFHGFIENYHEQNLDYYSLMALASIYEGFDFTQEQLLRVIKTFEEKFPNSNLQFVSILCRYIEKLFVNDTNKSCVKLLEFIMDYNLLSTNREFFIKAAVNALREKIFDYFKLGVEQETVKYSNILDVIGVVLKSSGMSSSVFKYSEFMNVMKKIKSSLVLSSGDKSQAQLKEKYIKFVTTISKNG